MVRAGTSPASCTGAPSWISRTRAIGEEGDESEPPQETTTGPEPTATTLALGEEGEPEVSERPPDQDEVDEDEAPTEADDPLNCW